MSTVRGGGAMDIAAVSRRQHGVVSRAQALEAGLSLSAIRHRIASGRWQRVCPGAMATHNGAITWHARASAALLHAGPGAALALESAAYVWGLRESAPPVLSVHLPHPRRVRRVVGMRVRRRRRFTTAVVDRLRVTSVAQTVIDLANEPGWSLDECVALAARAAQRRRVAGADLHAELITRRTHQHRGVLLQAFGDIEAGVQSVAELRFVRDVEEAHGLPPMQRQAPNDSGGVADFRSKEFGVIVEIDGQWWHEGETFGKDRRRDRRTASRGELTLRAGWHEVTVAPCELAVDIGMTFRARGWTGWPVPCGPGCPVSRLLATG